MIIRTGEVIQNVLPTRDAKRLRVEKRRRITGGIGRAVRRDYSELQVKSYEWGS
jgi:hypothetical protein